VFNDHHLAILPLCAFVVSVGCGAADFGDPEDPANQRSAAPVLSSESSAVATPSVPERPAIQSATPAAKPPPARARLAGKLHEGWLLWSTREKTFAAVTSYAEEGNGTGIVGNVGSASSKTQYSTLCEPNDPCPDDEAEVLELIENWLRDRNLEGLALEPAPFSEGALVAAELGSLGGKLVWKTDHLELVRGSKTVPLPKVAAGKEFTPRPYAAAASPDGKFVCVLFELDPGQNYAKGWNLYVEPIVYAIP
jgi:hypothetical protein